MTTIDYATIIKIVGDCSERMNRSGESHRMFAKWVSEGINAAIAAAPPPPHAGVSVTDEMVEAALDAPIDGPATICDWIEINEGDARSLGVLKADEHFHGYSDIRIDQQRDYLRRLIRPALEAALSRSPAPSEAVEAAGIKPLVWSQSRVFGAMKRRGTGVFGEVVAFVVDDLTEAEIAAKEAAAQTDYETRIRSALVTPPADDVRDAAIEATPKSVYLAARYSRAQELRAVRDHLLANGYTVTSRWIDGGHELTKEGSTQADEVERTRFAVEDEADCMAAAIVISFTEEPRKTTTRGGRHVEFGMARASGKRLIVIGHRENVFHCLPSVEYFPTWSDAYAALRVSAKQ